MNYQKMEKQKGTGFWVLLLFGIFAVCVLFVLLTGAESYSNLTQRDQIAYSERTCARYIATKIHQMPHPESLSVVSFGEGDALEFREEIDGEEYYTRVYCFEGWLRELFALSGTEIGPESGEKVLEAQSLKLDLHDEGLLDISITEENGSLIQQTLSIRGSREAIE